MKIALTLAILRNRFEEEKASKIVDEKLRRSWGIKVFDADTHNLSFCRKGADCF